MDVGTHHSAINILEEGLDETIHSVIKLVVSQSLKEKKEVVILKNCSSEFLKTVTHSFYYVLDLLEIKDNKKNRFTMASYPSLFIKCAASAPL